MQAAAKQVEEKNGNTPIMTADYRDILAMPEIDAVIVTTSWQDHIKVSIDAMKAGKYVGCEVGGAYSLEQCWELVRTYEQTGVPCMLMENCCYGRDELMVLNMVKKGVFGEVIHCAGGYQHDLRDEVAYGRENRHYRLENYLNRNAENYPTHELGPIAKVLNINRGNRMVSLVSMASKAAGIHEFLKREKGDSYDLTNAQFAQGDVITTMIKCAHGQTIVLTLDTTLPRGYSRGFRVQGTKAMYLEDNKSLFLDQTHNKFDFTWKEQWNNVEEYREQYDHPIWKQYQKEGIHAGHDGMDWLVFSAFFDAVKKGSQVPIDVYDMASWMAVTALSEESIAKGSAPVMFPDFTDGKWLNPAPVVRGHYCLDVICE
ncbi:MAG: Gfo/Idh/MocA family protein [Oscillospiraceae bacterium]